MKKYFRRWIPKREALEKQRGLGWLKPLMRRAYLWQWSRKRVSMGVAIGVFFAFLIPILQVLGATIFAVLLRANLPSAALSTLITNPITFAPIVYGEYRLGRWLLNQLPQKSPDSSNLISADHLLAIEPARWLEHWDNIGLPLLVGIVCFAVIGAVFSYLIVNGIWLLIIWRKWHRHQKIRTIPS